MAAEFTDANFEAEVISSDIPVVVDFSATWCGPCKQLTPIIESLAKEYEGSVKIGKVDIDENQDVATRFQIMSVPTVLFFKGGERVDAMVGLHPPAVYKEKIDGLL